MEQSGILRKGTFPSTPVLVIHCTQGSLLIPFTWQFPSVCTFVLTVIHALYFLSGYFRYLRALLNARVPSSLEPSATPPTPLAAAIRDLVMTPLQLSSQKSTEEDSTVFTANDRYSNQY